MFTGVGEIENFLGRAFPMEEEVLTSNDKFCFPSQHLHPRSDASHDAVCVDTKMCKNCENIYSFCLFAVCVCVCPVGFVLVFPDNWSVMVHLLLSGRVIPERRLALPAHYPLWRGQRVGEVLCRSHIEKLAAKATAGEDAEFVRD